jgi:sortase A
MNLLMSALIRNIAMQRCVAAALLVIGVGMIAQTGWRVWETLNPDEAAVPADVRLIHDDEGDVDDVMVATARPLTHTAATQAQVAVASTVVPTVPYAEWAAEKFPWEGDDVAPEIAAMPNTPLPSSQVRASSAAPTRLVIPSIHVDAPILSVQLVKQVQGKQMVSTWQVARDAVGFHNTSAAPGTLGNTVLSGHNNVWGQVFRHLAKVQIGDEVDVYVGARVLRYRVDDKVLLPQARVSALTRQKNAAWIGPTTDHRLTLVSCWPYYNPTHRIIVIARPIG